MQKLSSSEYNTVNELNTKPAFENWLKGVELKIERRWKNEVNSILLTFGDFILLQDLN